MFDTSPKSRIKDHVSVSALRDRLVYDPNTGVVTWALVKARSKKRSGDKAGCVTSSGYTRVKINGYLVTAHRIAWALHYGDYPSGMIDHINGDRSDNRIENLRVVTPAQSQMNRRVPRNNTSTFRGVTWNSARNKWSARCAANGKRVHLGYFDDAEEAHHVYQRAASSLHGEYLNKE